MTRVAGGLGLCRVLADLNDVAVTNAVDAPIELVFLPKAAPIRTVSERQMLPCTTVPLPLGSMNIARG